MKLWVSFEDEERIYELDGEEHGYEIELSPEFVKRAKKVMKEFNKLQGELDKMYMNAHYEEEKRLEALKPKCVLCGAPTEYKNSAAEPTCTRCARDNNIGIHDFAR